MTVQHEGTSETTSGVILTGDAAAEFSGVHVVTDKMSAPYLMGATIDFVDTIEKQGFTIDNPNASGSCACGDSFH
jgi:iron-sulfur cluster assembly accessory protein